MIRNCFGEGPTPWMAGDDAGELMVAALLHPDRFGEVPICYPPGAEALSQAQIAELLSDELSRPIRHEAIPMEQWQRELEELAERGSPALNPDMARHISALGRALALRQGALKPPMPGELERQLGRAATSFRSFVRAHHEEWLA